MPSMAMLSCPRFAADTNRPDVRTTSSAVPLLPVRVDTRPMMLDDRAGRRQAAVQPDRERRHAAAAVVGDERVPPSLVDGHVARRRTPGSLLVEEIQAACFGVDAEGTHGTAL